MEKTHTFEAVYKQTKPQVRGFLHKRINDKANINDMIQEIFTKVYLSFDSYNPSLSTTTTWVLNIAKNHVTDFLRKSIAKKNSAELVSINRDSLNDEHITFQIEDDNLTPDTLLEKDDDVKRILVVISRLDDKYRHIIKMFFIDQLKYDEIATKTGLPLGTIKTRLKRGKELIIQNISQYEKKTF